MPWFKIENPGLSAYRLIKNGRYECLGHITIEQLLDREGLWIFRPKRMKYPIYIAKMGTKAEKEMYEKSK